MTKVRCLLCLDKILKLNESNERAEELLDNILKTEPYNIQSNIIPKNNAEDLQLLGGAMITHMNLIHPDELKKIAILAIHWNGFNVMKNFESEQEDSLFEIEKEKMRDQLEEEIIKFAPEDDEFEDEDEDEEEDNDLTREDEPS